jgi:hypothetical protein
VTQRISLDCNLRNNGSTHLHTATRGFGYSASRTHFIGSGLGKPSKVAILSRKFPRAGMHRHLACLKRVKMKPASPGIDNAMKTVLPARSKAANERALSFLKAFQNKKLSCL